MALKVTIALSNMLFSEGVKMLLEGHPDIGSVEVLNAAHGGLAGLCAQGRSDVVLVDYATLCEGFGEKNARDCKLILIDTGCTEESIISAFISKGLKGVLIGNATAPGLKKAIKAVGEGEIWLDKLNVKHLLSGLHAFKEKRNTTLSQREWDVVSLVGQGYRNKEIAGELCISEPTVKTHMQRIFQKLGIRSRPQLITFAIKNHEGARPG